MAAPIVLISGPSGAGKTTVGRLVAASFELSVHMRMDDFTPFVIKGWVEPWLPESAHQNHVLGSAVVAGAIQFAKGGYAVVVDGNVFPEVLDGLAHACQRHAPLHYVVLRPGLDICSARLRKAGRSADPELVARLHARYADLADREVNVIDATAAPEAVTASVLSAITAGRLRVLPMPG